MCFFMFMSSGMCLSLGLFWVSSVRVFLLKIVGWFIDVVIGLKWNENILDTIVENVTRKIRSNVYL